MKQPVDPIAVAWKQLNKSPFPKVLEQSSTQLAGAAQVYAGKKKGKHLLAVCASLVLGVGLAHADHYRTGSLEELMGVPNWELVRQDFDVVTGEDYGRPVFVAKFSTLAKCDQAQRGRFSKPHNVGVKWVVGKYECRHRGDDVV